MAGKHICLAIWLTVAAAQAVQVYYANGQELFDAAPAPRRGPAAHYVIRTSFLEKTLAFTRRVLGMRTIRHEENPEACPITCNGEYAVPWSKTMVGTSSEDEAYALEITYNYGVDGYARGTALAGFDVAVTHLETRLKVAQALGYEVKDNTVIGPDGYVFRLKGLPDAEATHIDTIRFRVPDPLATAEWYATTLGMVTSVKGGAAAVSFPDDPTSFRFQKSDGPVTVEQFEGRNAFSLPAAKVRAVYDDLKANAPDRVVHDLQEINEETGLGVLLIAIVTDPNGLELCLVSSEAFEPAIKGAAEFPKDYKRGGPSHDGIDYKKRKQLALDYAETVAKAKAAKPDLYAWQAYKPEF